VTVRTRIVRRPCEGDPGDWPDQVHEVVRRVLRARGIRDAASADQRLRHLLPPDGMLGMPEAAALLARAVTEGRSILVVGDYDSDGATGVAVALRGLARLGATKLGYAVPHRFRHGYGLSPALVEEIAARKPDLIVTVDHGIASHAGVARARELGIPVLVTDHHLPGATLPEAAAIVNPNQPGCGFASKALAGVGVMFYLLLATRAVLRAQAWFDAKRREPELAELLDLVALGTVADLVPLDRNNRVLVGAGLRRIRAGHASAGLHALLSVAGRSFWQVTAADLGFAAGPRLNAAGRLEDMALGVECLLCDDARRAQEMATRLDAINAERKEVQSDMTEGADALLGALQRRVGELPIGVSLVDRAWHAGVVGLVASRLKDKLNRPVIAFAPADERGEELRGSARSVAGFHVRDALAELDAQHPGLIVRFGGHAMAAGLTLRADRFADFAEAFDRAARRALGSSIDTQELWSDGELGPSDFRIELAEQLVAYGPYGQAFPEPLFDGVFDVARWWPMKDRHLRLDVRATGGGPPLRAVQFNAYQGQALPGRVRLAYHLALDEWNGARRLQLLVRHLEPA
jgi:single-stranded-DNA-specific exonuclease